MTWWQAIILGVVEGVTEYLPVSSTGHLILAQRLMALEGETANAYAICIQSGAIVAVLGLYWRRVRQCLAGWLGKAGLGGGDEAGFRLGLNIVVAFMPAAVVGLLLDEWIETNLFGLWPIVAAWIIGGIAILAVDRWKRRTATALDDTLMQGQAAPVADRGRDLDSMTWRMALIVGIVQCLAMWPGTSRSLVTIVGGVMVGMSMKAAVEFSFLLGVVTLLAATAFKINDAGPAMLEAYGLMPMLLGSAAAFVSAAAAVAWMVSYLKRHGLSLFGWYRVAIGALVAGLLLSGLMDWPVEP